MESAARLGPHALFGKGRDTSPEPPTNGCRASERDLESERASKGAAVGVEGAQNKNNNNDDDDDDGGVVFATKSRPYRLGRVVEHGPEDVRKGDVEPGEIKITK